jgi:hypothetical protein
MRASTLSTGSLACSVVSWGSADSGGRRNTESRTFWGRLHRGRYRVRRSAEAGVPAVEVISKPEPPASRGPSPNLSRSPCWKVEPSGGGSPAFTESAVNQVISKRMANNSRCAGQPRDAVCDFAGGSPPCQPHPRPRLAPATRPGTKLSIASSPEKTRRPPGTGLLTTLPAASGPAPHAGGGHRRR